jgi:tetratricopeptide (TPR) repeat protein
VIIVVQAAHAVLVDDRPVLERLPSEWAVWPRFGARVRLVAGRHRLVARLPHPETSVRVVDGTGAPIALRASASPEGGYVAVPPTPRPDPNPLAPFLARLKVRSGPTPLLPADAYAIPRASDPVLVALAAELAHVDGQDDVATVLLEPLVADTTRATGASLAAAARYIDGDPVFAQGDAHDLAKDFRQRSIEKDPDLWYPQLWLALELAQKEAPRAVRELEALGNRFPEVPAIRVALAAVFGSLCWKVEQERAVRDAAARFPDDPQVLRALLRVADARGEDPRPIEERLRSADPRAPVDAERAVARGDYPAAVRALELFAASDPDRGDVDARIDELRRRAALAPETLASLERAVLRDPNQEAPRLALADARLAAGQKLALHEAIAQAKGEGRSSDDLREALETATGATLLDPYRRDGLAVVRAYESSGAAARAKERSATGKGGAAHAARVLDYAAIWVHEDGTSRMLEHEILHMQSAEAIGEHAEQRIPRGTVLHVRTIKPDGRILEPEVVPNKPTVTMPHLEVGDYVETETIYSLRSDGRGGRSWASPRWFFREAKVDYDVSEFVVITPRERSLVIETTGAVPAPSVREDGALRIHTWRVEKSPALPEEPASVPADEFLPSVRAGWGIDRTAVVGRFIDAANQPVPADPRLVRIARTIATAGDKPREGETADLVLARVSLDERAKRIYRWVVENVEAGDETDPRKVVVGKQGSRPEAFAYLCRLAGVEARHALVRDALEPEARGELSRATEFGRLAVRVTTSADKKKHRWLVVADRFVPYGFLPAELRAQPAIVLVPGAPTATTDGGGVDDGVTHAGVARVRSDGSATIELRQTYQGRLAIALRSALEQLPDARLEDTIERQLLPPLIPGARVASVVIENRDVIDAPLVLVMKLEVSSFARVRGGAMVISPPLQVGLSGLTRLARRETPMLLSDVVAKRFTVDLRVELPAGAKVTSSLEPETGSDSGRRFEVKDRVEKGVLVLHRETIVPAGRVMPEAYPTFVSFTRAADAAFDREIVVSTP